ncbi:MFS transporter [Candidatus Leptofilum sp.]|uniref:MFS transporter n=1 Tax=Candidatus Leptofilum sp. TaxID=3241576 RepID=UPI003B59EDB3
MLQTLKQRNFALLWTGGLISLIGNWILIAAMPFHIYAITGSALATSAWLMAYMAPGVIFGTVAGVFVDRWDRKRTMLVASFMQAAIILVLLFAQTPETVWLIYVVAIIESTLSQFFSPAENALLPSLVDKEHLLAANSLNSMNDNLARLIGPAIGGTLLGLVGLTSVILLDAASYILAGTLILFVNAPRQVTAPTPSATSTIGGGWSKVWRDWVAGLKLVRHRRILASLFTVVGIALFGDAIISAILVVFVQDTMGLSSVEFGWMMTARGIGGLIGGMLAAQLGRKFTAGQLISVGLASSGIIIFVAIGFPTLAVVLPAMLLVGIPGIIAFVTIQTLLQQETEDAYRGRIFGAFGTTTTLLMLIGSGMGGALTDQLGDTALMSGAAIIYVIAGLMAAALLIKPTRKAVATD